MARGVNKVILVGNVGADPEMRYTASGNAVANISLATSESWTDKNSGEKQERTTWHRITMFNRLGEIAGEYVKKGSQIYIEGSIRTDKYQDKNTGEDRYSTSIIANNMQLLGGPSENRTEQQAAQYAKAAQKTAPASAPINRDYDDDLNLDDSDIPF